MRAVHGLKKTYVYFDSQNGMEKIKKSWTQIISYAATILRWFIELFVDIIRSIS